jgi:hypothetical protein
MKKSKLTTIIIYIISLYVFRLTIVPFDAAQHFNVNLSHAELSQVTLTLVLISDLIVQWWFILIYPYLFIVNKAILHIKKLPSKKLYVFQISSILIPSLIYYLFVWVPISKLPRY